MKKNFFLLIITCLLLQILLSSCQVKVVQENDGLKLYREAWKIVKYNYYDPSLHNVDWKYWEHRYDKVIKTKEDAYIAIETMVESLNDRYTRFLTPDQFSEQDTDIESKISGIGVEIALKDNNVIVVSVLDDTPAQKAGLTFKDKITEVNGKSTKGLDLKDVAGLIRGKIGTYVKLTILKNGKKKYLNVKRDVIKIKSVFQKMLNNKISYIRLKSFISQDAAYEMEDAILNANNAEAFIIDVRGNYGGLLPNAISISNIFIDQGLNIVSIINRNGTKRNLIALAKPLTDKPLVVLIDRSSASASEILGGALKDHKRAILVGDRTFGKGLVQKIFDLPEKCGLNVTVSKYITPNGHDIDKKGVSPDIKVKFSLYDLQKKKDPQLEEAKKIAIKLIKLKKTSNQQANASKNKNSIY